MVIETNVMQQNKKRCEMNRLCNLAWCLCILILSILLAACGAPTETVQLSPLEATILPEPKITPTVERRQVPPCTFAHPSTMMMELSQTEYIFSEPDVVLASPPSFSIIQWLPDNQHLLILRQASGVFRQTIEVFDTVSRQTQIYAEQKANSSFFWLPGEKAVAYFDEKPDAATGQMRKELWLSYGDPDHAKRILENSEVLKDANAGLPDMPEELLSLLRPAPMPFDPKAWMYPKHLQYLQGGKINYLQLLYSSKSPTGSLIAFYGRPYWLFLATPSTGQVCEVDLGMSPQGPLYPIKVKWSPDEHYLAMTTSVSRPGEFMEFSHLAVLDMFTGKMYQPDLGISHIWDIGWMPDNQHLLVLGEIKFNDKEGLVQQLVLVNAQAQTFSVVLPNYANFGGGEVGSQMALSPDGQTLAIMCSVEGESRLCTSSIEHTP